MDINHNLVKDLKNMGIWEKVRDQILENQGDISLIEGIPQHIKDIYKTSFTTSPYAYIEVAARAQKWVDQALSRNMYLETRDIDETMNIYLTAWKKGLKSTYYLHMKPRHTAEQSTVKVNKAEKIGKRGFAAVASSAKETDEKIQVSAPIESPIVIPQKEVVKVAAPVYEEPIREEIREAATIQPSMSLGGFASVAAAKPSSAPVQPTASVPKTEPMKIPENKTENKIENKPRPNVIMTGSKTCPTDPAELAQCDSCQ